MDRRKRVLRRVELERAAWKGHLSRREGPGASRPLEEGRVHPLDSKMIIHSP